MTMRIAKCGLRNLSVGVATLAMVSHATAAQTSLSIYRDGRVVVRRTLPQALQQGRNALTLRLEALDPATMFSPDTSVTVVSATARYPSTKSDALAHAIGQTLSFVQEREDDKAADTVKATVVRVDPPQYRLADGRLLLEDPGQPLFPAELVRTAPEAQVVLEASRSRPRTEIAYLAQGMTWEALYQVIVIGTKAQISGTATVTSATLRADSAEVQLVAGAIRKTREAQAPAPAFFAVRGGRVARADSVSAVAEEQAVGETHVYQLPGRLTIEPGTPVATALFPRSSAPVTQELIVPGVLPYRGWIGQAPEPDRVPVQVWYTIKRPAKTQFGDRPLPAGTVQIYQADSSGRLQLIGEAANDHTAPGRDLRLQSGDAFDVTAERVQTDYHQEMVAGAGRGLPNRQRITSAYRVTITSAKTEPVSVDVRETHFGDWKITESSISPEKLSSTEMRFRVSVPAGGQATLTYTVQVES
ncbi:MAG: hypothetical protein AUI08_04615 [Gemmatimonadetes bacterium 13_2_20CM_2_65_7]|nr:MAG: hypothetical protein AUI08_04615 [Gemmatimonadetes bacterium 13_2_20CM_2_65_7]